MAYNLPPVMTTEEVANLFRTWKPGVDLEEIGNCVQNAPLGEPSGSGKPLKWLVGVAGLEPATPASRTYRPFHHSTHFQPLSTTAYPHGFPKSAVPGGAACRLRANPHPSIWPLTNASTGRHAPERHPVGSVA
jgi:hypothetical protein